jgi:glycosyltransferase involved in cell wall biosynthesis/ribosome-associated translation inhibitor RaiA
MNIFAYCRIIDHQKPETDSSAMVEETLMQFHLLAFEGPDDYARAGGIASRISGLACALADAGFETHLWFVGDPHLPGHDTHGFLHLHRWCQWISRYHPAGVYEGEEGKRADYVTSLPPFLLREVLWPHLQRGRRAVVLAEEWHTVDAVLHLDWLLQQAQVRDQVAIFWNANNTFGFHRIDWARLAAAATITTVSRYMKYLIQEHGVVPLVMPNGLPPEALAPPDAEAVAAFRTRLRHRTVLGKVARWDPDKRWLLAIDTVAAMKPLGWKPLLIARGGVEAHGHEVLNAAAAIGLRVAERALPEPGIRGLTEAIAGLDGIDLVSLRSALNPEVCRVLFQGSNAVLSNSGHEPFGLVGLETMAVGGVACTGCSGEDYAVPGYNALVLETMDPREFIGLFGALRSDRSQERALRRAGCATAKQYAWRQIIDRILLPRVGLCLRGRSPASDGQPNAGARARMQIRIEGERQHIAPPLLGWIADRLEDLNVACDDITYAHVTLRTGTHRRRSQDEACVSLVVAGRTLQAKGTADTLYKAASIALKNVERDILGFRVSQC